MSDLATILPQLIEIADQRIVKYDCCNWHINPKNQSGSDCDFEAADYFLLRGDPPVARFQNSWPLAHIQGLHALALVLRALGDKAFIEMTLYTGQIPVIAASPNILSDRLIGRAPTTSLEKSNSFDDLGRLLEMSGSQHGSLKLHQQASRNKNRVYILDMPDT